MSAVIIPVHPQTPDARTIEMLVSRLRDGQVILYPTDTGMALGCTLRNKEGIDRIRAIRRLPSGQSMTFLCESLSNISEYARVSNKAFKLMKRCIPGPFTFILPATKSVPVFAHDPKRRSVGIRVPDALLANALLNALGEPLISISAKNEEGVEFDSMEDAADELGNHVDVVVLYQKFSWIAEPSFDERSTIIDMQTDEFQILRAGAHVQDLEQFL